MCRMRQFLALLSSFFHSSLLCTFSCHPSPPTILSSSLTSSCHLFLGLPLILVVPKFIFNTLLGILFSSILCACPNQHNLLNTLRTGDTDLRFYVTTVQDGWRRFAFLTRWNSIHLQVILSATPQGRMFPEVSHRQELLRSLVSISWKFQFTKIVSEFVINF